MLDARLVVLQVSIIRYRADSGAVGGRCSLNPLDPGGNVPRPAYSQGGKGAPQEA